tara:strand:+ start:511 stop:1179 length:669 start_codon:yes stop_codon:yes gene_type:complete
MDNFSTKRIYGHRQSSLFARFKNDGATFQDDQWNTALCFTSSEEEVQAVRRSVGISDVSSMSKFDIRSKSLSVLPTFDVAVHLWPQRTNQYLLTCESTFHAKVQEQLTHCTAEKSSPSICVSDVTAVYTALLVAGVSGPQVLKKLVDIDISDDTFPNLHCVQTGIHHVYALVARHDLQSVPAYLLLIGREYGEWLWDCVLHAGNEFSIQAFGSQAHDILKTS